MIEYSAGTTKGETQQGDFFNSPFKLGNVDPNYTSAKVVESFTGADSPVTAAWFPVYDGPAEDAKAQIVSITTAGGTAVAVADDASVTVGTDGKTLTLSNGTGTAITSTDTVKVKYVYDNVVVPQNDLPTLKAELKNIPLIAKARRIAVYYSQIAAFQASTDYGINLGDQLAEKAVGQMSYEIDTEVTNLLVETAGAEDSRLVWSKTLPIGVSKRDHYAGFAEMISIAAQIVYDRTKRFMPNYMLCASDLIPVLSLIDGFKAAPTTNINGPYYAGTFMGMKVFVTPNIEAGKYCLGVNGSDMMSSVAVYAPYMPIVPTQLLQFNDGLTTQGWSTMYDLKVLNADLIVAGKITA